MSKFAVLKIENNIAWITLHNPPLNIVNVSLTRDLNDALDSIIRSKEVRAVVLTGAGDKAFCAGSDVREFEDMRLPGEVVSKKLLFQNAVFRKLEQLDRPTIAAINGLAYGGGLELAMCCDFIIAEPTTRFALPELNLGVFPSSGGTYRLTRRIGEARAKQMIFLGEPIDSTTALDYSLINYVSDSRGLMATVNELADKLVKRPALALGLAKHVINRSFDHSIDELVALSLQASDRAFSSHECVEGVRAFFAKDTPDFITLDSGVEN